MIHFFEPFQSITHTRKGQTKDCLFLLNCPFAKEALRFVRSAPTSFASPASPGTPRTRSLKNRANFSLLRGSMSLDEVLLSAEQSQSHVTKRNSVLNTTFWSRALRTSNVYAGFEARGCRARLSCRKANTPGCCVRGRPAAAGTRPAMVLSATVTVQRGSSDIYPGCKPRLQSSQKSCYVLKEKKRKKKNI